MPRSIGPAAKLALVLWAVFVALSAALTAVSYQTARQVLEKEAKAKLKRLAATSTYEIDRLFFERSADMHMMATDAVLSSPRSTPERITRRLLQLKKAYPDYASISYFDMDRVRIADTEGRQLRSRHGLSEFWPEISRGSEFVVVASPSESSETRAPFIYFAAKVRAADDRAIGVLAARMDPSNLLHAIRGIPGFSLEERRRLGIDIVDQEGRVQFSNHEQGSGPRVVSPDWPFAKAQIVAGEKAGAALLTAPSEEQRVHAFAVEPGYRDFRGDGWVVIFDLPTSLAFAAAGDLKRRLIAASALVDLLALALIYAAARICADGIAPLSR